MLLEIYLFIYLFFLIFEKFTFDKIFLVATLNKKEGWLCNHPDLARVVT
jgi:hypothetical protein